MPAVAAGGTSELPTVSVSGNSQAAPIRHDVRQACPQVDAALQESLAPVWGRVQEAGSMRVKLRIQGDRVVAVTSTGLARDYRSHIRKAVAALKCSVPAGTAQTFEFVLSIQAPQDPANPQHLALRIE